MKDKLRKLLLIVPVVGFLFLVPLLTLISKIPGGPLTPTASYSVWENRTMAVFPQLTAKGFWDGSYFAGWETALSDQFYGRDYWLKAHTRYAMLRRSASVNDVVITEETLLPQQTATDYKDRDLDAEAQDMAQGLAALPFRRMWACRNSAPSWNSAIQAGRPPTAITGKRCGTPLCRPWRRNRCRFWR